VFGHTHINKYFFNNKEEIDKKKMIEYFKDHLFIYQISIKLVPTRMNNLPDFEQNTVTLNSKTLSHLINTIQGCPLIITICSLNVL